MAPGAVAASIALSALVSCFAPAEQSTTTRNQAITHSSIDGGDPGVVGLVDDGTIYCTATMVSARVAVTAGHCIGTGMPDTAVFGTSIADGEQIPVIDARAAAGFELTSLTDDIAAVLLAQPAPADAVPWPLRETPFDDSVIGSAIRIVGFGETENPDDAAGTKREGSTTIASFTETAFRFTPNPSQTCLGDSGGPAFLTEGDVEYLVGVTSSGDPGCAEFADDTRVDAFAADLIEPYVQATAEGAADEGERCFYPESCAVGECREPVAPPAFSYCASACQDSDDCADGMTCVEEPESGMVCRFEGAEPGALGAPCGDRLDCATDLCVSAEEGVRGFCTQSCRTEADPDCPADYECRADPDQPTRYLCFRTEGCSCGLASAGHGRELPWLPAALFLVLLAGIRRSPARSPLRRDRRNPDK